MENNYMQLTILPFSFIIRTNVDLILNKLKEVKKRYTKYDSVTVTRGGKRVSIEVEKDKYIAGNNVNGEYIFILPELKNIFTYALSIKDEFNIDMSVKKILPIPGETPNIKCVRVGIKRRDYQARYIKEIKNRNRSLISLQTGKGKMLLDSTPILMSKNSDVSTKPISEIKIGDYVQGRYGTPALVNGVYHNGLKKLYKITFEDGRYEIAGLEHQWVIVKANGEEEVVTTKRMIESFRYTTFKIPLLIPPLKSIKLDKNLINVNKLASRYVGGYLNPLILETPLSTRGFLINSLITRCGKMEENRVVITLKITNGNETLVNICRSLGYKAFMDNDKLIIDFTPFLKITDISLHGYDSATCISVNTKDKTYVTGNYTVTHNTFIALSSIEDLKDRTVIVIKPIYISMWKNAIKEHFGDTAIISVIQGSDSLKELMRLDKNELPDFIIISNRTMSNYYTEYESSITDKLFTYPVTPYELFKELEIGTLLIDEAHEEFLSVYKTVLYSTSERIIALTATLTHSEKFIRDRHDDIFPHKDRLDLNPYDAYVTIHNYVYALEQPRPLVKAATGAKGYTQIGYEQGIMKIKPTLKRYLKLHRGVLGTHFIKGRKKGEKAIVFAQTVKMCEIITNYLRNKYPKLKVLKYTQEDPYSVLDKADIIVSTPKSAGTAVDIKGLRTVVSGVSTNSNAGNLQLVGRVRKKGGVMNVSFLYSRNIRAHTKYRYNRDRVLSGKVKKTYTEDVEELI